MKPRAYSYLRFSRPEQAKGDSLRRQTALRDTWLAKKGLILDDSLTIRDLGVSAFRGKNLTHGALSGFIAAVKSGRVPKGSYLVIEKLDRFSRDDADEALPVFTQLVKAGVIIVTLDPEKEWDTESIKGFGIMELVLHFVLANQESEKKSSRLRQAWGEKKRLAKDKPPTKMSPHWVELVDGKWQLIPAKVKVMQRIFTMAESGHGSGQIAIMLNKEKIPSPSGGATGWYGSGVLKLLRCRQVVGEYQPCSITPREKSRRKAVGEPIPNYYPQIVREAQWRRVQKALDGRRLARGKVGRNENNLFQGLLLDARDGGVVRHKIWGIGGRYLVPKLAERGIGKHAMFSFDYRAFERSILGFLNEIKPADLSPISQSSDDDGSEDRLAAVETKIAKIKKRMMDDTDLDGLLDVVIDLEKERKQLAKHIAETSRNTPEMQRRDLIETKSLTATLAETTGEDLLDLRARLKGLIHGLILRIHVLVADWGDSKICFAQVTFRSGGSKLINIVSTGKGITHFKGQPLDVATGCKTQFPVVMPTLDLRLYQSDKSVRDTYAKIVAQLNEGHPQTIAIRRVASGEKAYLVARDMGIASGTVYSWAKQIKTA